MDSKRMILAVVLVFVALARGWLSNSRSLAREHVPSSSFRAPDALQHPTHFKFQVQKFNVRLTFPPGTYLIPTDQKEAEDIGTLFYLCVSLKPTVESITGIISTRYSGVICGIFDFQTA